MTWILYFGLLLIGAGAGGGIVGYLLSRNLPGPGQHTGPMLVADREPTSLLTPPDGLPVAQQAAHADAMHAISAPYLGIHERTIPRVRSGVQPWETAPIPALTETGQQRRCDFIKSQFPEHPDDFSDDDLRATLASAMHSVSAIPVFGEAPVATVLAAQETAA